MSDDELLARDAGERVAAWLTAVARVPPDGFTPVERFEEIPGAARADSWFWCDSIFAKEVNPHNEALGPKHAFHLATEDTPDLLRHEVAAGGIELVVTEGRNFVLVQVPRTNVDVLALDGPEREAAIRRLAETIFNESWESGEARAALVTMPRSLCEGAGFSSNPAADPALLTCWSDRAECGIHGGCLYFLCYKKSAQRAGFANARQWFDEEFRRG